MIFFGAFLEIFLQIYNQHDILDISTTILTYFERTNFTQRRACCIFRHENTKSAV
jgi:hypothetical protein